MAQEKRKGMTGMEKRVTIRMDATLENLVCESAKVCEMKVHDLIRVLLRRGLGLKPQLFLVP